MRSAAAYWRTTCRSSPAANGRTASASMPSWPSRRRSRCSAVISGRRWAALSRPTCRPAGPISTSAGNGPGPLFFAAIGVGPSIHTGDELYYSSPGHKALGSRVLFHIPLELGIQVTPNNRIALYYEHASNGFHRLSQSRDGQYRREASAPFLSGPLPERGPARRPSRCRSAPARRCPPGAARTRPAISTIAVAVPDTASAPLQSNATCPPVSAWASHKMAYPACTKPLVTSAVRPTRAAGNALFTRIFLPVRRDGGYFGCRRAFPEIAFGYVSHQ